MKGVAKALSQPRKFQHVITATEDIKESTRVVLVAFGVSLFTFLFIKHKLEMRL